MMKRKNMRIISFLGVIIGGMVIPKFFGSGYLSLSECFLITFACDWMSEND